LILTGRREKEINAAASDISKRYGVRARVVIAELADGRDVEKLVDIAKKDLSIEVLVNNAGFGARRRFTEDDIEDSVRMVMVHDLAPMRLIRELFPRMIANKRGTIINVSSMAAFLPTPASTLYTATKAFLHSLSESLFMEAARNGVQVQSLCPGFTYSDFAKKLGARDRQESRGLMRWMEAEDVARASLAALGRGTPFFVPGFLNRTLLRMARMIPKRLYYLLAGGYSRRVLSAGGKAKPRKRPV
jgi:short-subunit dehydrogenase